MFKPRHILAPILTAFMLVTAAAAAGERPEPGWWEQAGREAALNGYQLISTPDLDSLIKSGQDFVLLDVRPDYEYQAGHLPGAVNLEFHLGDRMGLGPEKEAALRGLLGPDQGRLVVIYCRSFRCLRSGIAAAAAAKLGYSNVRRDAAGWQGWQAYTNPGGEPPQPRGLSRGDIFPACRLVVLRGERDRKYLGLPQGAKAFSLGEVKADCILVEFYNELCYGCLEEVSSYNHLFRLIEGDPQLGGRLKMLGLGVGSTMRAVAKFRRDKQVLFPLFADQKRDVFQCLGTPELPVVYLLKRVDGQNWRILFTYSGQVGSPVELLDMIKGILQQEEKNKPVCVKQAS